MNSFGRARLFPQLGVFPGDVNGVVEVKQQSFAPIEKAETKNVVIDEGEKRTEDNVDETETALAFRRSHLGTERRVAVHVLDVGSERRVRVMKKSGAKCAGH